MQGNDQMNSGPQIESCANTHSERTAITTSAPGVLSASRWVCVRRMGGRTCAVTPGVEK